MPYDPRIKNRAGAIYAGGIENAAAYQAQGIQQSAAGIANGIKIAGVEFGEGIEKAGAVWQKQAEQKKAEADLWSALNTKIDTYGKMGYLTGRDADALAGIKKPNDLAAAPTVVEQDIGRRQQQQQAVAQQNAMFERQYALEAMKRQQEMLDRQNSPKPGDKKEIVDDVTGEKTTYIWQNSGQLVKLDKDKKAPELGAKKVEIEPGVFVYQDMQGNTIDPKKLQGTAETSTAARIEELKIKRSELAGEVAKGNKKKGADWMPGLSSATEPYEAQIKGIDAQISALEGGAPVQSAGGAPPAAAAPTYSSPDAVQAAYRGGQLSREEALKILTTQFGYQ